jgi:hypothetical protein
MEKPVISPLRAAAALLLALGAAVAPASSVSASPTPSPTPTSTVPTYVEYTGNSTDSSTDGHDFPGTFPSHIRIDCSSGECVVTVLTIDDTSEGGGIIDMSQGQRLVLVNGKGSFPLPAFGDLCGAFWISAGVLTIDATATGFTGVRTSPVDYQTDCPDHSSVESPPYVATARATVSGGNPCVLDGTCPTPTPTAIPVAATATTPHGPKATHFASPSTLSSLPTVKKALTLHNALWAAAITVVLVLLVAFPTHLFNTATEHGADRIRDWWSKRGRPRPEKSASSKVVDYRGWPLAAGGVLLASLISSFVDPTFGFNASSVRVYLSILTSFLLDAVAGWFLLIYLVRRVSPHATATFRFAPATLLVVAAAVVFTRLTGFAPGIIFGLVAGVAFGAVLATAEKARVALVGLGYSFVVAVIGWIGYSIVSGVAGAHPSAGVVFLQETLSSMAIGGIAALPIALVPLRGLAGYDVFTWNRWAWGGAYGIGLLGFFVVLMPLPFSWTGVHINLIVWIGVYIAYALAAAIAWLVLAKPWKNATELAPLASRNTGDTSR